MENTNKKKYYNKSALRIALIYILISALWIIFSDRLFLTNPDTILFLSTLKGWIYTVVIGIFFYFIINRELNKRNQIENNLIDIKNKYYVLIDLAADGIMLGSHDGIITDVNRYLCDMVGLKKEDIIGKEIKYFPFTKESIDKNPLRFDLLNKGEIVDSEREIINSHGSKLIIEMRTRMMPDGTYQSIYRDITNRKNIEEKLKESEKKYHELVENSPDAIIVYDTEGKIIFINKETLSLINATKKEELIGKSVMQFVHPDSKALVIERITKSLKEKIDLPVAEEKFIKIDGTSVKTEVKSMPIIFNGKSAVQVIIRDITDREKASNFLKLVVNSIPDFIFWKDRNSVYLGCNEAFAKVAGLQFSEDIIGKTDYDLNWKKEESDAFIADDRSVMESNIAKYHIIEPQFQAGGKQAWLETSKVPLNNDKGQVVGILGAYMDITERINIEERLKESEEKFRRLFESAKDSILLLDADTGEITDSNPFIQDLLGYSAKELIGKKIFEISPFRDIIENKEKFNELQNKGYVYYDNLPLKTKSGIIKQVEFVSNVYIVGDKKVIQCNIRDLTEKIKLEESKVGFLSIASHQLRTPLSMTKWVLEALLKDKELTISQKNKLNDLVYSNDRLINLIEDLLNVSMIETGKLIVNKKLIDLGKLIDDLVVSLKSLADKRKKNIKIINLPDLKEVYCDPILVNESLENLLTNAFVYAKEDSKDITISVEDRKDDYLISVHNEGYIDTISSEKINIFDKFSRGADSSKIEPSGSGLGLFITKKMMEASGGNIWFESNIGSGTTFYLTIVKNKLKE
jgi:PAS domain S-box-containing protein